MVKNTVHHSGAPQQRAFISYPTSVHCPKMHRVCQLPLYTGIRGKIPNSQTYPQKSVKISSFFTFDPARMRDI